MAWRSTTLPWSHRRAGGIAGVAAKSFGNQLCLMLRDAFTELLRLALNPLNSHGEAFPGERRTDERIAHFSWAQTAGHAGKEGRSVSKRNFGRSAGGAGARDEAPHFSGEKSQICGVCAVGCMIVKKDAAGAAFDFDRGFGHFLAKDTEKKSPASFGTDRPGVFLRSEAPIGKKAS